MRGYSGLNRKLDDRHAPQSRSTDQCTSVPSHPAPGRLGGKCAGSSSSNQLEGAHPTQAAGPSSSGHHAGTNQARETKPAQNQLEQRVVAVPQGKPGRKGSIQPLRNITLEQQCTDSKYTSTATSPANQERPNQPKTNRQGRTDLTWAVALPQRPNWFLQLKKLDDDFTSEQSVL